MNNRARRVRPLLNRGCWGFAVLTANLFLFGCGGGGQVRRTPPPPSLAVSTTSLPSWMVGFPYQQTVQATGGLAPYSWKVSSGALPQGLALSESTTNSVAITGTPDTVQAGGAMFTIQVSDSANQVATRNYSVAIQTASVVQLAEIEGTANPNAIELQNVAAGPFDPAEWQQNTLNWVPDVRVPMLAPLPGAWQNIYSPWPLEQPGGWRLFYGGWDGTATPNDRIYSMTTSDFLSFENRHMVIDHGDFVHVNNVNVSQLADGSMHMICTVPVDPNGNDKPAYFASPDGVTWNGVPEPYSAQLADMVSIPNDPDYAGWDFNGGNVLLWDDDAWTFYYSVGIYGAIGQVYRARSSSPAVLHRSGIALNTVHYSNDVKKFVVDGKEWYLMALYVERATTDPTAPALTYSLSNDGVTFGAEQVLFLGSTLADKFLMTPAFVVRGTFVEGVVYGANGTDLLGANSQIFARWLQKKVVLTDALGNQYSPRGGYGPDRQWFDLPQSFTGTITVYGEDGRTPLGTGPVALTTGKSYRISVLSQ